MHLRPVLVILLAVTLLPLASAFEFRGFPFGTDAVTFIRKYRPSEHWSRPMVSYEEKFGAVVVQTPMFVVPGATVTSYAEDTIAGVRIGNQKFLFWPGENKDADILNSGLAVASLSETNAETRKALARAKLFKILIGFEPSGFEILVEAYKSKYGAPTRSKGESFGEALGGHYDPVVCSWHVEGAEITIQSVTPRKPNGKMFGLLTVVSEKGPDVAAEHAKDL